MRKYTIYKDATGKLFGAWDDMTANGDWPKAFVWPFTTVEHGEAQGIRELTNILHGVQSQK